MNRVAVLGLAVALTAIAPATGRAHEVEPMIVNVAPSGAAASFRLMIRNTDAVPITLEILPRRVAVDDAGDVTRTPADDDVLIYPDQVVVAPGDQQAVQVRYVGEPDLTEARVYGLIVDQLPIDFTTLQNGDASTTQVKIGFNFVSHMVVTPPGALADLRLSAVGRTPEGDLTFDMTNDGKGVALLRNAVWTLSDDRGESVVVPAERVRFGAFGAILPGGRRSVVIAAADAPGLSQSVSARLSSQ